MVDGKLLKTKMIFGQRPGMQFHPKMWTFQKSLWKRDYNWRDCGSVIALATKQSYKTGILSDVQQSLQLNAVVLNPATLHNLGQEGKSTVSNSSCVDWRGIKGGRMQLPMVELGWNIRVNSTALARNALGALTSSDRYLCLTSYLSRLEFATLYKYSSSTNKICAVEFPVI